MLSQESLEAKEKSFNELFRNFRISFAYFAKSKSMVGEQKQSRKEGSMNVTEETIFLQSRFRGT